MVMDAISSAIGAVQDALPKTKCLLDEPMRDHTSFRIGAPVRAIFFPKDADAIIELQGLLEENGITPLIMGNGTNMLVNDCGTLDIIIINTKQLDGIQCYDGTNIKAGAGVPLSKLAAFACEHSLSGLEFAHGIPGTLGGAIAMNAGAYGGEMKDVVESTCAYSGAGIRTTIGNEHGFTYRSSRFACNDETILSSILTLQNGEKESIRAKMEELSMRRRESQPLELPSAGSTFKRPKQGYAAALIEQAGLKGYTIGGAQVSEKHSGFIVNRGEATFADVMAVIEHVQETVIKQFGIELELEIKVVSGDS